MTKEAQRKKKKTHPQIIDKNREKEKEKEGAHLTPELSQAEKVLKVAKEVDQWFKGQSIPQKEAYPLQRQPQFWNQPF